MIKLDGVENVGANSCLFCKAFNELKRFNKMDEDADKEYTVKYSAVLMQENYYMGDCLGSVRHMSFALNFCPTCGKSLKEV